VPRGSLGDLSAYLSGEYPLSRPLPCWPMPRALVIIDPPAWTTLRKSRVGTCTVLYGPFMSPPNTSWHSCSTPLANPWPPLSPLAGAVIHHAEVNGVQSNHRPPRDRQNHLSHDPFDPAISLGQSGSGRASPSLGTACQRAAVGKGVYSSNSQLPTLHFGILDFKMLVLASDRGS
jgi:hypothetical protein